MKFHGLGSLLRIDCYFPGLESSFSNATEKDHNAIRMLPVKKLFARGQIYLSKTPKFLESVEYS